MNYLKGNDRKYKMFAKMLWLLIKMKTNEIPISSK